ncbi:hypothetical protein D3C71_1726050 [compost metagenome]
MKCARRHGSRPWPAWASVRTSSGAWAISGCARLKAQMLPRPPILSRRRSTVPTAHCQTRTLQIRSGSQLAIAGRPTSASVCTRWAAMASRRTSLQRQCRRHRRSARPIVRVTAPAKARSSWITANCSTGRLCAGSCSTRNRRRRLVRTVSVTGTVNIWPSSSGTARASSCAIP